MVKRTFIDIRTIGADGNIIEVFNINHASVDDLMSILRLAEVGSEVTVIIREEQVENAPVPPVRV